MHIILWMIQILLAFLFLLTGMMKLLQSKEQLQERGLDALRGFSQLAIHLIGIAEVLGAFGLILPQLTGILPWLTPLAALGLALVMVGAIPINLRVGDRQAVILNIAILILMGIVVYGRFT